MTLTWGGHILPLTISLATAQKRHHAVPALLPATQGKQLIRSLNPSIRIFCISAHNFYITIVITVFVYCYCISILLLLYCYSYYLYCHCSISKVLYIAALPLEYYILLYGYCCIAFTVLFFHNSLINTECVFRQLQYCAKKTKTIFGF